MFVLCQRERMLSIFWEESNMKKRLFCLVLCLLLVLPVALVSCAKKTDDEALSDITSDASESTATVSMWLVSENKLTDATVAAVEKELSSITESKFRTKLELTFTTRDVYEQKLAEEIAKFEENNQDLIEEDENLGTEEETTTNNEPQTETNEYGFVVYKYPELLKNQVDIIYIASEDMFRSYVRDGFLAPMDAHLSTSAKQIKEYVSATLLDAVKENGKTYAIPNNNMIGEYTYMMLNKYLVDKYCFNGYINENKINGFFNDYVYDYLETVAKYETDFPMIDSDYEDCLNRLAHFWSFDSQTLEQLNSFSIFGHHYTEEEELTRGSVALGFDSLFENPDFVADYLELNKLRFNNYFCDVAEGEAAAIKFVKGDATIVASYADEYYMIPIEKPTATSADIYDNMFGVYANSQNIERSMQIITYLNTNRDFRNLLQYGIENTHFKFVQDTAGNTLVQKISDAYQMSVFAAGNMFLAYPSDDMAISEEIWKDDWKLAKAQNREALVSPLLGFNLANEIQHVKEDTIYMADDTLGFYLDYATGYSKEVLSQDAEIAKWIAACDAKAEKGVNVLKTMLQTAEGEKVCKYYFYNNAVAEGTDVAFKVSVDEKYNHIKEGKKIKKVLEYFNLAYEYETVEGERSDGYELSVVTMYFDVDMAMTEFCKVNGEDATMSVTEAQSLVEVNTLNNGLYQIEMYEGLLYDGISQNSEMKAWIDSIWADRSKGFNGTPRQFYLYSYSDLSGEEKDVYVFASYVKILNQSSFALIPYYTEGNLTLTLTLNETTSWKLESGDNSELINYFTVTVDKGTVVTCNAVTHTKDVASEKVEQEDGTAYSTASLASGVGATLAIAEKRQKVSTVDPNFRVYGMFNYEYLKYVEGLNNSVIDLLNSCETYEEFEAVVNELSILFSTSTEPVVKNFKTIKDFVSDVIGGKNGLKVLYDKVRLGTGLNKVDEQRYSATGDPYTLTIVLQNSVYTDTPYNVYYNWMKANNYLPEEG